MSAIIIISFAAAVVISLCVANLFVPVRYLYAYINFSVNRPAAGETRVRFIDVGEGDCTLFEFPDGKTLLVDGGNGDFSHELTLLKTLNSSGIDKIDFLVCASTGANRCGGLAEIIKYKQVGSVFLPCPATELSNDSYRALCKAAEEKDLPVYNCAEGEGYINAEVGYLFTFLNPSFMTVPQTETQEPTLSDGSFDGSTESYEEPCAAVWVEYLNEGFLLLGGADKKLQSGIAERLKIDGGSYVFASNPLRITDCKTVLVPFSGVESALDEELFLLISPERAIISISEARSLPSDETLYGLTQTVYRTDYHGTVTVITDGYGCKVFKEKA